MHRAEAVNDVETEDAPAAGSGRRRWGLIGVVFVVVIALDQLTKSWAVDALSGGRIIPVVWTLQFELAFNKGAAFSMGSGTGWTRFLPIAVLFVVGWVVWQGRSAVTRWGAVAIGLILGGALGNLIDRALRTNGGDFFSGGVVDFINFQWWPVFNVADSAVVVGGLLLVVVSLFADREPDEAHERDRPGRPGPRDEPIERPGDGP